MMNPSRETKPCTNVVAFGEVLWDLFPDGPRLGGAPANVAYHVAVLGDRSALASCIGNDDLGRQVVTVLAERGVTTTLLQTSTTRPTGTVNVTWNGSDPHFEIAENVAWIAPIWTEAWAHAFRGADAVCFGSLVQSWPDGRQVLDQIVATVSPSCWRLLDLNLRSPHDSDAILDSAIRRANAVKMSEEESKRVAALYGVSDAPAWLIQECGVRAVAITRGARGSVLTTAADRHEHPGFPVDVSAGDPVGAGDAFTAAFLYHLTRGSNVATTNAAANGYASFVASKRGAMPEIPPEVRARAIGTTFAT